MSKVYNKPFIVGVLFTVAVFIIANSISYFVAYNAYLARLEQRNKSGIVFSNWDYFYVWGFPFDLCRGASLDCFREGIILNTIVVVFFSFTFGFLFKFIWPRISHHFVKLD